MHWSYPGTELWFSSGLIFTATLLEFLGLPAPGGPLLVMAAAGPTTSNTGIFFLIIVAGLAAAAGDAPWYFLGRYGGARLLRSYCKYTLGSGACVANTERFFHRFGILALTFSKFVPGVRLFAPPFAGSAGYPFASFLYLDVLGGLLWAGSLVLLGRTLGPQIPWAFTTRWVLFFNFGPVTIFFIAKIVKRMIKGTAEEALQLKPMPKLSVPIPADAKETII